MRDFSVSPQQQAHASEDHAKFFMVVGGAVAFSVVVMLFVYLGNARELPPDAPDLQQEL